MTTKTEWTVDKTHWIAGPWMNEPDHLEFEHAGYPAQIRRSNSGGNWCGYVGVPPEHPWHGKDMFDVDASVHGGITYSRPCAEGGICFFWLFWFSSCFRLICEMPGFIEDVVHILVC